MIIRDIVLLSLCRNQTMGVARDVIDTRPAPGRRKQVILILPSASNILSLYLTRKGAQIIRHGLKPRIGH